MNSFFVEFKMEAWDASLTGEDSFRAPRTLADATAAWSGGKTDEQVLPLESITANNLK